MKKNTAIVDCGRGPQLSTSRITVQDLVPYFQSQLTIAQIVDILPTLTIAELHVVERYIRENFEAVMEQDRRIRERNTIRKNAPEIDAILQRGGEKMAALRTEFEKKKRAEKNGDHADA